ncbi:MAG TPA: hypothetical protein PLB55_05615 [Prosthecobacter sp.]|jgi:hypothetical protein|nr:hypothetical protein [Prosthecobacter sp.]
MKAINEQVLAVAQIAVQLLPHTKNADDLSARCISAANAACEMVSQCSSTLSDLDSRDWNKHVADMEADYYRTWEEIQRLSRDERQEIDAIRKRFQSHTKGSEVLAADTFLKQVLLPGRKHTEKTLLKAWREFARDLGKELPFDLRSAVLYGPTFIREVDAKISTWLKRQKRQASKRGGSAKQRSMRRRHGACPAL